MDRTCARCQQVVYPIEELKCLDKVWHRTCFKCTECGMALNMKTYKGFDKQPYCDAHVPKVKATVIVDTPELKRFTTNTQNQSNVKYHADFEKAKGKCTQVTDDAETMRLKNNTKNISNIAYRGDLQKKENMERLREGVKLLAEEKIQSKSLPNSESSTQSSTTSQEYKHDLQDIMTNHLQQTDTNEPLQSTGAATLVSQLSSKISETALASDEHKSTLPSPKHHKRTDKIYTTPNYIKQLKSNPTFDSPNVILSELRNVFEISNKLACNDCAPSTSAAVASIATQNTSCNGKTVEMENSHVNIMACSIPPTSPSDEELRLMENNTSNAIRVYRAVFDYEAQDIDELTIQEGDSVVEVEAESSGWMVGRNVRTGKMGMLPANHVKLYGLE